MTQTPWIHAPTEELNRPTMHQEMHCALSKLESNKADKRELLQAKRLKGFWKSRQGDHHKSSDKLHSIHKDKPLTNRDYPKKGNKQNTS